MKPQPAILARAVLDSCQYQYQTGHDYYFYIRSVNTVGKSAFVEAVGRASDDAKLPGFFQRRNRKTHLAQSCGRRLITVSLRRTWLKSGRPLRMSAMNHADVIKNWKIRVRNPADTESSG
nr:hypothetical protein [Escherichia coli]